MSRPARLQGCIVLVGSVRSTGHLLRVKPANDAEIARSRVLYGRRVVLSTRSCLVVAAHPGMTLAARPKGWSGHVVRAAASLPWWARRIADACPTGIDAAVPAAVGLRRHWADMPFSLLLADLPLEPVFERLDYRPKTWVYTDANPGNWVLTPEGRLWRVDFGVAEWSHPAADLAQLLGGLTDRSVRAAAVASWSKASMLDLPAEDLAATFVHSALCRLPYRPAIEWPVHLAEAARYAAAMRCTSLASALMRMKDDRHVLLA